MEIYIDRIKRYGLYNVIKGLFHKHEYSTLIWRHIITGVRFTECCKCGKRKEYDAKYI